MKSIIFLFIAVIAIVNIAKTQNLNNYPVPSVNCGQVVTYAGEKYPTVQIGAQCWFKKNLNVGAMINGSIEQTNNNIIEKYCYNNNSSNCTRYGGLYQWDEAIQFQIGEYVSEISDKNVQGICPSGWHIPSQWEWWKLESSVQGGSAIAIGNMLKSNNGLWVGPNNYPTNSSGFSALPGGSNGFYGFSGIGEDSNFWSSSSYHRDAYRFTLVSSTELLFQNSVIKSAGFSVRCLKD